MFCSFFFLSFFLFISLFFIFFLCLDWTIFIHWSSSLFFPLPSQFCWDYPIKFRSQLLHILALKFPFSISLCLLFLFWDFYFSICFKGVSSTLSCWRSFITVLGPGTWSPYPFSSLANVVVQTTYSRLTGEYRNFKFIWGIHINIKNSEDSEAKMDIYDIFGKRRKGGMGY